VKGLRVLGKLSDDSAYKGLNHAIMSLEKPRLLYVPSSIVC
jgi:hypothetical protein